MNVFENVSILLLLALILVWHATYNMIYNDNKRKGYLRSRVNKAVTIKQKKCFFFLCT